MVIGTGMIAQAFKQYENIDDVIIFASGVSNSKEQRDEEFSREFNLLEKINLQYPNKKIVYFSTVSIFDSTLKETKYIEHKLKTESFIKDKFEKYIIFRLPIVIGWTKNEHTFFNYFKNKIINQETIEIKRKASRFLIDVDDLAIFLPSMIKKYEREEINICYNNKVRVTKIIELMEFILGKSTKKIFLYGGGSYNVKNEKFMNHISNIKEHNRERKYSILRKQKDNDIINYGLLKKYLIHWKTY